MIFKNIHIKVIGVLIALLISGVIKAQTINISDTIFARYIFNNISAASPELGKLDTVEAKNFNGIFYLNNTGVTNINEIQYFKNSKGIIADGNKLSSFPKLTGFNNIEYIFLNHNRLTKAPDVSDLTTLTTIDFRNNLIKSIPEFGANPNLSLINADNNYLTQLPDFSQLPNLDSVTLRENKLNWPEIRRLAGIPGYNTIFNCFPQKEITNDKWCHIYKGESITIEYPDTLGSDYVWYRWFSHNLWDSVVEISNNKIITIDSIIENYSIYEVASFAKNLGVWTNKTILSGETYIYAYDCPAGNTLSFEINFDCTQKYTINFSELNISYDTLMPNYSFIYNLLDSDGNILHEVNTNNTYPINPGIYKVQITNNNSCSTLFDTTVTIPEYPVCECIEADVLNFTVDFNCNSGYIVQFNDITYKGLSGDWVTPYLADSLNNRNQIINATKYPVMPGNYKVLYSNNSGCEFYFDTVISINAYPVIDNADFDIIENCNKTEVEINSVEFSYSLSLPEYYINSNVISENGKYTIESGENYLFVKQGLFCYDSILLTNAPVIPECNCINQVDITTNYKSDCKKTLFHFNENSAPNNYVYNVLAVNDYTGVTDTLTALVNTELNHGIYTIKLSDSEGCEMIIQSNLQLKQTGTCDAILYDNVPGGTSTYYVEGKGRAKLVNEAGKVIYEIELPANITTNNLDGSPLPTGLYVLLFNDGSSLSVTIVR